MAGRRLSDHEFLSLLAEPGPPPGSDLDVAGRFLLLPLAERDRAWVLESCREDAEGEYYVLPDGGAVVFAEYLSDLATYRHGQAVLMAASDRRSRDAGRARRFADLSERIAVQIRVEKRGSGRSVVRVVDRGAAIV